MPVPGGGHWARDARSALNFAEIEVSVPAAHEPGKVELPRGAVPDPARDFVTRAVRPAADAAAFRAALQARIPRSGPNAGEVIVTIHGFDNTMADGVYRTVLPREGRGRWPDVASKHAVNGMTRNAAVDYAPYGIRVNPVNMAATDSPMIARAGALVAAQSQAAPNPGMGRLKTTSTLAYADQNRRPSTVAEQVFTMVYLLSPEAGHVTGAAVATDGGWTVF